MVIPKSRLAATWLRPSTLLLAAIVVLIAAHAVLLLQWRQQEQTRPQVQADIAIAQRALSANTTDSLDGLRQGLRTKEAGLASLQDAFPTQVNSTALVAELLGLVRTNRVELVSFQGRQPRELIVGQHQYRLYPFNFRLQGNPGALVDFLGALENTEHTLTVGGALLSETEEGTLLELDITLYTRIAEQQPPTPATGVTGSQTGNRGK